MYGFVSLWQIKKKKSNGKEITDVMFTFCEHLKKKKKKSKCSQLQVFMGAKVKFILHNKFGKYNFSLPCLLQMRDFKKKKNDSDNSRYLANTNMITTRIKILNTKP